MFIKGYVICLCMFAYTLPLQVDLYPFNSFTEASLSLFFETSGISESNFSSLLEILSHDSFKKEDVPPNVSVFKVGKAKLDTMAL